MSGGPISAELRALRALSKARSLVFAAREDVPGSVDPALIALLSEHIGRATAVYQRRVERRTAERNAAANARQSAEAALVRARARDRMDAAAIPVLDAWARGAA